MNLNDLQAGQAQQIQMNELVNCHAQIFPTDPRVKFGTIMGVFDAGVLFKITMSEDMHYKVGEVRFIAFSAGLTFAIHNLPV